MAADGVQIVDALTVDVAHVADVVHTECAVQADESTEATDFLLHDVNQEPNFLVTEELVVESHAPWRSWRSWRSWYCLGLLVADATAAVLAFGFCYLVRPAAERSGLDVLDWRTDYKVLGLLVLGVWLFALMLAGSYRTQYPGEGLREYRVPVVTALRLMAVVAIASFAVHAAVSRLLVVVFFPSLVVACLFTRWVMRQVGRTAAPPGICLEPAHPGRRRRLGGEVRRSPLP